MNLNQVPLALPIIGDDLRKAELEEFDRFKERTELQYKEIKSVHCPALKADVIFNSDGFHHLRFDNCRKERNKKAQKNKFRFLMKAVDILKKTTTIQEYRRGICPVGKPDKGGLRKTSLVEWFGFYAITSFIPPVRIMVVVRRIGRDESQFNFWSVMPYWSLNNKAKVVGSKEIEDK